MGHSTSSSAPPLLSRLLRWSGYILFGLVILLMVLVYLGMFYQAVGEAQDRREYPPPGQLVDVGGYQLHIFCTGEGSPTVILDAMADGMSVNWVRVQTHVAGVTRVCSYDRVGLGWSDSAPTQPRDALQGAEELHALLQNGGIPGPYVLVGHSYGAHVVRVFADKYSEEVVGIALVDPGILFRDPRFPPEYSAEQETTRRFLTVAPWLARLGLIRLSGQGQFRVQDLPAQQRAEYRAAYNTVHFWQALYDQFAYLPDTTLQVQATENLGDLPLVVLSASRPDDETRLAWNDMNAGLALLSSRGVHRVVNGATHAGIVQDEKYARETSAAIIQVVQDARQQ